MGHAPGFPDHFEIVNGPEDGTAFPINRTPVDIGSDGSCAIFVAHDREVARFHARVTVVSDGYRVRRLSGGGPVYVGGKRAGFLRSRVVRSGGVVQVGSTEICLQAAPEGLASRSYGLPTESDAAWAVRFVAAYARRIVPWAWSLVTLAPRLVGRFWLPIVIGMAALWFLRPHTFAAVVRTVRYWIEWTIWRIGQIGG